MAPNTGVLGNYLKNEIQNNFVIINLNIKCAWTTICKKKIVDCKNGGHKMKIDEKIGNNFCKI